MVRHGLSHEGTGMAMVSFLLSGVSMAKTILGLVALLTLSAGAVGCKSEGAKLSSDGAPKADVAPDGPGEPTCTYNGRTYPYNVTFMATDGCNECWCAGGNPTANCTGMRCANDAAVIGLEVGGKACSYDGKEYPSGATFPSTDGCNTCECLWFYEVACTMMACLGDAGPPPTDALPAGDAANGSCVYNGKTYPLDVYFIAADGCNDCHCGANGQVACTLKACLPDAGPQGPDAPFIADLAADSVKKTDAIGPCMSGTIAIPPGGSTSDGCNTCMCSEQGVLACTGRYCPPDAAADANASCILPTGLSFGNDGGMVLYSDKYSLDPKTGMSITRTYSGRSDVDGSPVRNCSPPLPACGASGVVSLANIIADLAASDVQAAFKSGTTPLYGVDSRPMDGTVYSVSLVSGGAILVGGVCSSSGSTGCVAIPAGVQRLVDDLRSLATAATATAECKGL